MGTEFKIIVADAQPRMAQLKGMSADIDAQVHDIIAAAPPEEGLSKDDIAKIQALEKKQRDILTAHQQLALVCAAALDDSETLKHLAASLTSAVAILKAETAAIAAVSARCAEIGAVCTSIDGIIAKLTALIGPKAA
jgi:16S rRNA U1498 N3-methylase RsmE